MKYATKTEIYQKIKKPLLERQRRARINTCLDGLKQLMVDLNGSSNIFRMDKIEVLETTIAYLRQQAEQQILPAQQIPMDSFRNGYVNAVSEISCILDSTPGMTVEIGKCIMTHLGRSYNKLQQQYKENQQEETQYRKYDQRQQIQPLTIDCPLSPASSGYHSDDNNSPAGSPKVTSFHIWRPW